MQNRVAIWLTLGCILAGTMAAADDPFVGKWKFNVGLSKLTGEREVIEDAGGNGYKFVFGTDSITVLADGTDQPIKYGGTMSIKETSPNTWTSVRKMDGKVISTSTWKVSDDQKMFVETSNGTRADGTTYTSEFKAKRIGGGKGLAGTWESTEFKADSYEAWEIEPNGSDGLSFITPAQKERLDMKFDGKDYTDNGPHVAPGAMSSGKRADEKTIELTDKLKDQVMDHCELKVSADGKTLTAVFRYPGEKKPQTIVYDRQ